MPYTESKNPLQASLLGENQTAILVHHALNNSEKHNQRKSILVET